MSGVLCLETPFIYLTDIIPPAKINKVKFFRKRFNCAPAKGALEKERRREGGCLTLPLNLFKKQLGTTAQKLITAKEKMENATNFEKLETKGSISKSYQKACDFQ